MHGSARAAVETGARRERAPRRQPGRADARERAADRARGAGGVHRARDEAARARARGAGARAPRDRGGVDRAGGRRAPRGDEGRVPRRVEGRGPGRRARAGADDGRRERRAHVDAAPRPRGGAEGRERGAAPRAPFDRDLARDGERRAAAGNARRVGRARGARVLRGAALEAAVERRARAAQRALRQLRFLARGSRRLLRLSARDDAARRRAREAGRALRGRDLLRAVDAAVVRLGVHRLAPGSALRGLDPGAAGEVRHGRSVRAQRAGRAVASVARGDSDARVAPRRRGLARRSSRTTGSCTRPTA